MISYDTEKTKEFVEKLIETNKNFAIDFEVVNSGPDVSIQLTSSGQCYKWQTRTVLIQYSIESVAHEVHHAAQHVKLGDNDSAVFGSKKGCLALEVSALATGEAASGGNAIRKIKEMIPIYHDRIAAYQCEDGPDAAITYAFTKKWMLYSQQRLAALNIKQEDCL